MFTFDTMVPILLLGTVLKKIHEPLSATFGAVLDTAASIPVIPEKFAS